MYLKAKHAHPESYPVGVASRECGSSAWTPSRRSANAMLTEPALILSAIIAGVCIGLLAHEWAHAGVLHFADVEYTVTVLPNRNGHPLMWLASVPWAVVDPRPTPGTAPLALRAAALAPLLLALPPLLLSFAGFVPSMDAPIVTGFSLGWLACAIPSPRDFSVAFYAHEYADQIRPSRPDQPVDALESAPK